MNFQVIPLQSSLFEKFYGKDNSALEQSGALGYIADEKPGYPCRVSLRDAEPGERLVLSNFEHQPGNTPYRSAHAVFVIEGAADILPIKGKVPEMLACRLLSVRAFDKNDMMVGAEVLEGRDAAACFEAMLLQTGVAYLHVHTAKFGCYLARIERD